MKILVAVPLFLLAICIIWHPAYLFIHMFNEPDSFPWRFSYIVIFMLVSIAAYECSNRECHFLKFVSPNTVLILTIPVLTAYFIYYFTHDNNEYISLFLLIINILFAGAYMLMAQFRAGFYSLVAIELLIGGCVNISAVTDDDIYRQAGIERLLDEDAVVANELRSREESDSFSRWSILNPRGFGYSFLHDYKGINFFSSFENTALWRAMFRLDFGARAQCITDDGSTEFTDMLFSVRYKAYYHEDTKEIEVFENERCLPLAFAVSNELRNYSAVSDPFENQQKLANAMTNKDEDFLEKLDINYILESCTETSGDGGEVIFTKISDDASVLFLTNEDEEKSPYLYFMNDRIRSGINEQNWIVSGKPFTYTSQPSIPHLMRFSQTGMEGVSGVGLFMNGDIGSSISVKEIIGYSVILSSLDSIYSELVQGGIQIDYFSDTHILGRLTNDSEHGVLFTSIPYDQDWRILIDGTEVSTYSVIDGAFLACDITPGTHTVEFIYEDQSLVFGVKACFIGIFLFLVLVYSHYKTGRSGNVPETETCKNGI